MSEPTQDTHGSPAPNSRRESSNADESEYPFAPKQWYGRFLEDLAVGDTYTSRLGRTITEADNVWFTCLTLNTNQAHFNQHYAEATRAGQPLVNSTFTLALVTGLTVPDTSENAVANLGWENVKLPHPVFVGDTLWAQSEVLALRESVSRPEAGVVGVRSRGVNQDGIVVIEFKRSFLLKKRTAPEISKQHMPPPRQPWTVT